MLLLFHQIHSPLQLFMNKKLFNWLLFLALSFIWGSSFILMKEGLKELSAYEVAAMRMLSAGVILLPFAIKAFRQIQRKDLGLIIVTGLLGSFIPAILFCLAETKIDSAVAGMLNALTPLFVITVGAAFFHSSIQWKKLIGVLIGFSGMLILFFSKAGSTGNSNLFFASLILIATFCYGLNVNLISHKLSHIGSLNIAAVAFVSLIIPSLIVLFVAGYFQHQFSSSAFIRSTSAAAVLGIFGTAIASVLFYMLMKRAGALFSSMVTYGVPFVAVAWGINAGEMINFMQMIGLCVILLGVYLANRQ
jgi:drug/metabolite transporter (DMT)-like permease